MKSFGLAAIFGIFILFQVPEVDAQVFDSLFLKDEVVVLFKSDDAEPIIESDSIWNEIVELAKRSDEVVLQGHTDEVGSLAYNEDLSTRRVERVKEMLVNANVEIEKLKPQAFGELKPLKSGRTESVYQQNRRVSLLFYKSFKMRNIHGRITDKENGSGIEAKIILTGKDFKDSTVTDLDGRFDIAAPDKAIYKLEASAKDYFFEHRYIKISPLEPVEIDFELPKMKIGGVYVLPNFNFVGNLPVLLKSSEPTLELLFSMLNQNDFCFEIEGHINLPNEPPCKKDTWHYKLSVDRAEMVYNHMVRRGIKAERLLPIGYGNWEMLFPATRDLREMSENRRVEIKIIDCNSEALKEWHLDRT